MTTVIINTTEVAELIRKLEVHLDFEQDTGDACENTIGFLHDLLNQAGMHQLEIHDGFVVGRDSQGKFIKNLPCPSSCELNGCNGRCKTYL